MSTRFPCLTLEGGLLATDLLDQIGDGNSPGQRPANFGLSDRTHLTDEVASLWTDARAFWNAFQHRLTRVSENEPATSETRDQWLIPLLSVMGYEPAYNARAHQVDGLSFAISHRAQDTEDAPPVHTVGWNHSLDRRPSSGRPRLAPHSLLQEYLNRTEHVWGIVSNGRILRILRDSLLMRRQAYVEFDLVQMMDGNKFADFALLYRLIHRSRLPRGTDDAGDCLLEQYYRLAIEQGSRVREHLRDGVEQALRVFANGLLQNPANENLRQQVSEGRFNPDEFYQQLLRLVYRLLFLMVAEERNLISDNPAYREHYSVSRLRRLAEERSAYSDRHDLWASFQITCRLFQDEKLGDLVAVPPLNGDLFDASRTAELSGLTLSNRDLLTALWHLSMYQDTARSPWRRVNYAALDVEELGSVYESLLEFKPIFLEKSGVQTFDFGTGTERKSTGSYYTPPELVNELIQSALVPVVDDRLKSARTTADKEKALLNLKICDPAAGSGHFLLAAARHVGKELAKLRTGDDEPAPEQVRLALRDVITHCIYAVDKNPLAVDLCKVALWIEGHARGKPLTFIDHRIRCGDSLVGVFDLAVLREGIPDAAYKPVFGDDKAAARAFLERNRDEREHAEQVGLFRPEEEIGGLTSGMRTVDEIPDDTTEQIRKKASAFESLHQKDSTWWRDNTACTIWTAAFFANFDGESQQPRRIPSSDDIWKYLANPGALYGPLAGTVGAIAQRMRFLHWPIEFPGVFARGGFDVVLGNPPWERIKLQEKEFFASKDAEIANAKNKAARQRLIVALANSNPLLATEFSQAKHESEATGKFARASSRFPLGAVGDINTYTLFVELACGLLCTTGRSGLIVPAGIATDNTTKALFSDLLIKRRLASFLGMDNEKMIFSSIDHRNKFGLLCVAGAQNLTWVAD